MRIGGESLRKTLLLMSHIFLGSFIAHSSVILKELQYIGVGRNTIWDAKENLA